MVNAPSSSSATFPNGRASTRHRRRHAAADPGIGAQGGDLAATMRAGQTANGNGVIINSSRAIIYANAGEDYTQAAQKIARETRRPSTPSLRHPRQ